MGRRILILGASGCGSTTLARHLGSALETQVFDADDFYWHPTDPPFQTKRTPEERMALMSQIFLPRSDWILAGSPVRGTEEIIPRLTHVIFLTAPTSARLGRLYDREAIRKDVLGLDGPVADSIRRGFMTWTAQYDKPHFHGRSRALHEDWLSHLPCPVIRLSARLSPPEMTRNALAALDLPQLSD